MYLSPLSSAIPFVLRALKQVDAQLDVLADDIRMQAMVATLSLPHR